MSDRRNVGREYLRPLDLQEDEALRKLIGARLRIARLECDTLGVQGLIRYVRHARPGGISSEEDISKIESGQRYPPVEFIVLVAEASRRRIGWFFGQGQCA